MPFESAPDRHAWISASGDRTLLVSDASSLFQRHSRGICPSPCKPTQVTRISALRIEGVFR